MTKIVTVVIGIIIIVGMGYWTYQLTSEPEETTEAEVRSCQVDSDCFVFGEDGDCNCGCFNKNYAWEKEGDCFCAAPKSCQCVEGKCEGIFEETKEAAIKNLLAEKYDKDVSEVTISITQETENHARGMVSFSPGGPENSGMFLAAKANGTWQLLHDGQGAYACSMVEQYGFPSEMTNDCFSQ